jgi:hypothetical protein
MDVHNINISNGNHVQFWECLGGLNQQWNWYPGEGTLRPEEAQDFCLDDASGGTRRRTPLDVWQCDQRANVRWNFDRIYIRSLGHKCLEFKDGKSVLATCLLGNQWTYNESGMLARVGTNKCLDVAPGEVGSQARVASCDGNRYTQKFLLTPAGQLLSNGRCLEVADSGQFKVNDNTPIRLAECDNDNLAQKFSFEGWLKSSGGNCVTWAPTDISRNGVRLIIESCNIHPLFFTFYFGDVMLSEAGSFPACGGNLHIKANHNGIVLGTMRAPFRTIGAAYAYACNGAQLHIQSGSYPEKLSMSKQLTILAEGGKVTIGR